MVQLDNSIELVNNNNDIFLLRGLNLYISLMTQVIKMKRWDTDVGSMQLSFPPIARGQLERNSVQGREKKGEMLQFQCREQKQRQVAHSSTRETLLIYRGDARTEQLTHSDSKPHRHN